MNTGIIFIVIAAIMLGIFVVHNVVSTKGFIMETKPLFAFLMESDYEFLLSVRYQGQIDVDRLYGIRVRNGLIVIILMIFLFFTDLKFIYVLFAIIAGFVMFKLPYQQLKSYYSRNLYQINLLLPYYLKSLEILAQHYTIPVALSRSVNSAPEIFKPGLRTLVSRIEAGDSTVEPYMDFARQYPVRDSMRMMRLLYRLSLGNQNQKQEQLLMFSRTVSALQAKSREQKYASRLESMEKQTMLMLFVTGGGILMLMLLSMLQMMSF